MATSHTNMTKGDAENKSKLLDARFGRFMGTKNITTDREEVTSEQRK